MKPFSTITEQIEILESRGMIFDRDRQNKNFLILNNYYNVINVSGKFFLQGGDQYLPGTNFKEIIGVYEFDKFIKTMLFTKITEVETHLRSLVSYWFCATAPDVPYNYLDANNYENQDTSTMKLINDLQEVIDKHKNTVGHAINHYHVKHGSVPLWVLVNHLSFGTIEYMIKQMPSAANIQIANVCNQILQENLDTEDPLVFNEKHLKSYVTCIRGLRNIVSHNNKLFGYHWKNPIYQKELHTKYGFNSRSIKNDVYSVFLIFQCFLSKEQFGLLHDRIKEGMLILDGGLRTINCNSILQSYGFPINWHIATDKLLLEDD